MEMVSKPWQDRLMYPILVKSSNEIENKENIGSQMGLTKKKKSISNIEANLFNQI